MRTPAGDGAYVVRAGLGELTRPRLILRPCRAELLANGAEQRYRHANPAFESRHLLFLQELEVVHAMLSFMEGDGCPPRVDGRACDVLFRAAPPVPGEAVRRDVPAIESL